MNKSVYSNFINLIKTKQKHTWSAFFIYHFVEGELKKQTLLTFFVEKVHHHFAPTKMIWMHLTT